MYPVDISINILAILGINIDDSVQKFSLELNCATSIQILRFWHAITQTDWLVLMSVDLTLYVVEDNLWEVWVQSEHFKILQLFQLNHLYKGLTNLPVLLGDLSVYIKSAIGTTFLFELHVQLADSVDRICFLPYQL